MGSCLGDPMFHAHCRTHKCELEELESYDNWLLYADLSGFSCPGMLDADGNINEEEFAKCDWAVSPIGRDDVNVFDLLPKPQKEG